MPDYPMTDVIASREYILERDGNRMLIYVELGKPIRRPEKPNRWVCPWSIRRPSGTQVWTALGWDSLDALTTALSALRIFLEQLAGTGKLTFGNVEGPAIELS